MTVPWSYLRWRTATYEREREREREEHAADWFCRPAGTGYLHHLHSRAHNTHWVTYHVLCLCFQSHRPVIRRKPYKKKETCECDRKYRNSTSAPQFLIRKFIFCTGIFKTLTCGMLGGGSVLFSLCAEYCVRSFEYHYVFCNSSSGPTLS